jgi:hypothetical protein
MDHHAVQWSGMMSLVFSLVHGRAPAPPHRPLLTCASRCLLRPRTSIVIVASVVDFDQSRRMWRVDGRESQPSHTPLSPEAESIMEDVEHTCINNVMRAQIRRHSGGDMTLSG